MMVTLGSPGRPPTFLMFIISGDLNVMMKASLRMILLVVCSNLGSMYKTYTSAKIGERIRLVHVTCSLPSLSLWVIQLHVAGTSFRTSDDNANEFLYAQQAW